MTRIVEPAILACPRCNYPMRRTRYASIHFYAATYWSDGYTSTISVAGNPDLGVCCSCESIFWVEDAEELGIMHREPESTQWPWWKRGLARFDEKATATLAKEKAWRAIPDQWHFAGQIEPPRARELLWALAQGVGDTPARERRLRQKIWWVGNHPDRGGYAIRDPMTPAQAHENRLALLELVRQDGETHKRHLTEAELLRQLGYFDEALAVLEHTLLIGNETAVLLAENARARETKVVKVGGWSELEGG
nr:hypothetical protein [Dechloromonas sp.]